MSIFNAAAPGGGGEIKSESFSVTTTGQAYINTITTNTVPSWYILVGRDYSSPASTNGVVKSVIGINAVTAYAYTAKYTSSSRSQGLEERITPTTTSGKLRFTVTEKLCFFYGNYTLYYID